MPLRLGILGYGCMAGFHENLIARVRGVALVAVADPTPARRKAAADKGLRVYRSEAELLADPDVDAVVAATPSNLHAQNVIACARAGKHVMTEKPMALTAAEARAMIAAAKRAGVVFTVFHNRRYDSDYLTVRRAVEGGLLGRIFTIESRISMWSSPGRWASADWRQSWRIEKRYGGGGLYDWGSHLVDQMLQMVASPVVSVYANMQTGLWAERGVDDYTKGMLDFANGVTGLIEVNYMAKFPLPRWYVVGEKGTLKQDGTTDGKLRFRAADTDLARDLEPVPGDPAAIYETWRDAIARKRPLAVRPEQVLRAVRLIEAFHRSSATKQAVRLEPAGRKR